MQQIQDRIVYKNFKEQQLHHRYITNDSIEQLLKNLPEIFNVSQIGLSVKSLPIYKVSFGTGRKKLLLWSQMHGNESTTTKALFDVFNLFAKEDASVKSILNTCTIVVIPILNPDGAKAYTRFNANSIDLNRDAQELSQPESRVLRALFNSFQPDICFNLHGQRTIFSAGEIKKTAAMSFLSPSSDAARSINSTRKKAMELIAVINTSLQEMIPNQVGRYDDGFNANCVGDTFQSLNVPTVLYEAGHFPNDYAREQSREYVFYALMIAFEYLVNTELTGTSYEPYFEIPENKKLFYDVIIRDVLFDGSIKDVAIQFQETLVKGEIVFFPKVEKIASLNTFFGHREISANKQPVFTAHNEAIYIGYENDFVMLKNELLSLIS